MKYLYSLGLTFPSNVESFATKRRPRSISKARRLIFVLSNRDRFINSRQNEPLDSLLVRMRQRRARLLPFVLCNFKLFFDGLIVLVKKLLSTEGLIIIHRRLYYQVNCDRNSL